MIIVWAEPNYEYLETTKMHFCTPQWRNNGLCDRFVRESLRILAPLDGHFLVFLNILICYSSHEINFSSQLIFSIRTPIVKCISIYQFISLRLWLGDENKLVWLMIFCILRDIIVYTEETHCETRIYLAITVSSREWNFMKRKTATATTTRVETFFGYNSHHQNEWNTIYII